MVIDVPIIIGKNEDGDYIESIKQEVVYDIDSFPYNKLISLPTVRKKNKFDYINVSAAFDIEDYTIDPEKDDKGKYVENPEGYMYHWQFCISKDFDTKFVCFGTRWEEFLLFIDRVKTYLNLGVGHRLVVYCHFLSHEFQYMKNFINIESIFAREERKPIKVNTYDGIEFRCSYFLSNNSLRKFCESSELCDHWKLSDTYDYKKKRTPDTPSTLQELAYDFNDVYGLCQCIDSLLIDDSIATIPLTSTGFVRRDARKAVQSNLKNMELFHKIELTADQYNLCKEAARGGDTHASRFYSNKKLKGLKSADEASAYPWVMATNPIFPVGKYKFEKIKSEKELDRYNSDYATLFKVGIYDVEVKEGCPDTYIPIAKCTRFSNVVNENGRVYSADYVEISITGADWEVIKDCYDFESFSIIEFYYAEKGYIYTELINVIIDYFMKKTTLKNSDFYYYMKSKNKLNAIFGMMLTAIDHDEILYNSKTGEWSSEKAEDTEKMLRDFYDNRNSFLPYQWGIYVTAGARYALHELKKHAWEESVYWDTDSLKYFPGIVDYWINEINKKRIEIDENAPVKAYVDYKGKRYYLGIFEDEGGYREFKTLGSKKYCYSDGEGFHITVSGMDKEKGAERIGSVDGFEITGIPLEDVGRTVSYYNEAEPHEITIDGCTFLTASNVGIVDTTYTLGITNEYAAILEKLKEI